MAWYRKEAPTPFDNSPIDGLLFLDGDRLAKQFQTEYVKGQKFPVIMFPSEWIAEIWESQIPEKPIVHIVGELDLPLSGTQDSGFTQAIFIAKTLGYVVQKVGESQLEVWGLDEEEHVLITYADGKISNVEQVEAKPGKRLRENRFCRMTSEKNFQHCIAKSS